MKIKSIQRDGMLLPGAASKIAQDEINKGHTHTHVMVTALNGCDVFLKDKGKVRATTQEEYDALLKLQEEGKLEMV